MKPYPLVMQLLENILWGIFLEDLEKTIWLNLTFYILIDSVKKMRTLMSHALPSQSHVDSHSVPFISMSNYRDGIIFTILQTLVL